MQDNTDITINITKGILRSMYIRSICEVGSLPPNSIEEIKH